jgi:hypothetical protein
MTTPADVRTDEEAFGACLAGRPVPAGAQGLAAFTDAVRASATAPGRPNAALAELLATGLLVPTQEPSRGTAGRPARTSRKRPHVLISTLTAKFAAAGAVAKAATATGVVAVALTGATTTVALVSEPTSVETTSVSDESTTPETDPSTAPEGGADQPASDVPTGGSGDQAIDVTPDLTSGPEDATDEDGETRVGAPVEVPEAPEVTETPVDADQPVHPDNFGAKVSADARDGGVNGREISRQAQQRNDERRAKQQGTPESTEGQPAESVVESPTVEESVAPAPHAGKGNGNGNGKGNGGK